MCFCRHFPYVGRQAPLRALHQCIWCCTLSNTHLLLFWQDETSPTNTHTKLLHEKTCTRIDELYCIRFRLILYNNHLEGVLQNSGGPQSQPHALYGAHERLYDMRRRLEYVRPDVVQQVIQSVFTSEAVHSQSQVQYGVHSRLSVNQISTSRQILIRLLT